MILPLNKSIECLTLRARQHFTYPRDAAAATLLCRCRTLPHPRAVTLLRGVCVVHAQGKFYPFRDTFRRFHLMTVPLSPARAALLLGGAAKHMGYDTYQVCGLPSQLGWDRTCLQHSPS